jgi:hypothetical protein
MEISVPEELGCVAGYSGAQRCALWIKVAAVWENDGAGEKYATRVTTIATTRSQKHPWPTALKMADAGFGCSRLPEPFSGKISPKGSNFAVDMLIPWLASAMPAGS